MRELAAKIVIGVRDAATAPLRAIRRQFTGLRGVVTSLGTAFATYFSFRAIAGFFTGSVGEAASLEEALSRIQAVTGATGEELQRLKKSAEDMGASTRYSASEAAGAMEALGRAGLNVSQTIEALPAVLALAQGNSLELAQAASIVTQAAAGMGLAFEEAGRVADVLTKAAASANTNVEGLGQALSYAAPTARALGLEIEDLAAITGKLADAGIDASRAGTALNNIFSQFQDPASQFRRELRAAGITTEDFVEAMAQLEAAGPRGQKAILAVGQNAGPALRALLGQGIGSVRELAEELRNAEGAADAAAATMDNNLAGALAGLGSVWSRLKSFLGEPLLGRIAEEARALSERIREAVDSGALDRLRDSILDTFNKGVQAIKDFVSSFGPPEKLIETLTEKFQQATSFATKLGAGASAAGNAIIAVFQGVNMAVSAVGTVLSSILYNVARGVNGVIQGLNRIGLASDLTALKSQALVETLDEMTDALAKRTVDAARAAAEATGKTVEALGRLNQEAEKTPASVAETVGALEDLADAAEDTGRTLRRTADEVGKAADEQAAHLRALRQEYEDAKASGASLQELGEIMQRLTRATEVARQPVADLTGAFEGLGIKSQEALRDAERAARQAFDEIRESGQVGVEDIKRAFVAYAKTAVEANDGVVDAALLTEAAALGVREEVEKLGGSADKSADDTAKAFKKVEQAAGEAKDATEDTKKEVENFGAASAEGAAGIGAFFQSHLSAARGAVAGLSQATENLWASMTGQEVAQATSGVEAYQAALAGAKDEAHRLGKFHSTLTRSFGQWANDLHQASAEAQAAYYAQRVEAERALEAFEKTGDAGVASMRDIERAASLANNEFTLLDDQTLSRLHSAIDGARSRMDALRNSAKDTLGTLEEELLRLQGREDELAKRRQETRRDEIRGQIEEARAAGDQESVRALEQSLRVLEQIGREQEKQRREQERERKEREKHDRERQRATQSERARADDRAPDATRRTPAPPTKTVRIELGGAYIDAPEDQAARFIRELERQGMRAAP